jgi:hypothetical protein
VDRRSLRAGVKFSHSTRLQARYRDRVGKLQEGYKFFLRISLCHFVQTLPYGNTTIPCADTYLASSMDSRRKPLVGRWRIEGTR